MERILGIIVDKVVGFVVRFNKVIIGSMVLITIASCFLLSKINIGSAMEVMYPPRGDPDRNFLEETYRVFGTDRILTIAIMPDNLFSYSTLKKIQKLTLQIEKFPTVDRALSLTSAALIEGDKGILRIRNLTSEKTDFDIEGAGYVRKGEEELLIQKVSESVPRAVEGIEKFKDEILSNPLYANNLVSGDLKTTIINVYFRRGYTENELRKTAAEIKNLALQLFGAGRVHTISPMDISTTTYELISRDLMLYMPLTILIIVMILLISFRDWKVVFLSLVSLGMSVVCVYALMAAAKAPIFVMTATIPPIIATQGLAYCIHLYSEYFRQRTLSDDRKIVVKDTLKKVFPAIFLSALAASIGFISIAPVNVVAIRQMGIVFSIGIVIVFMVVSFFVSAMLIYLHPKPSSHVGSIDTAKYYKTDKIPLFCMRRRILVFVLTAVLGAVSVYGFSKLVVESDVVKLYRPSSPFRQAVDLIARKFKGASFINVIIEGRREYDLTNPAVLKSIDKLQGVLDKQPIMGKSTSVIDYLKFINKAVNDNDPAYFNVPDSTETILRYLKVYSLADPTGALNRYIDEEGGKINIALRTATANSAEIVKFKKFIEEQCARILPSDIKLTVTGDSVLIAMTAQKLSRGILYGFTQATLMIFLIMAFLSRSIKVGAAAMVPNITPLLFVLGVMGFAGISFNVGTSIVVCIAIGIAVDDTIHFLVRYFDELKKADLSSAPAGDGTRISAGQRTAIINAFKYEHGPITLIGVSVILGFIILVFSQFVPMALFGLLTALALFMGVICELIILPALLSSIKIKKKKA